MKRLEKLTVPARVMIVVTVPVAETGIKRAMRPDEPSLMKSADGVAADLP